MLSESSPKTEISNNPQQVAEQQLTLGSEWADIFAATGTRDQAKTAEIALRNPAVYLHDVRSGQLPEAIRLKWSKLLELSEAVVKVAGTEDKGWSESTSGIEKLQGLMFAGSIDAKYRGSISDVIRLSSELFAESTAIVPGNTNYYKGNVLGMQSWIRGHRQSVE